MCRAVRCKTCQKTTWAGCGLHIDQVRARVPSKDWCPGHNNEPRQAAGSRLGDRLRRLLGHRPENQDHR